MKINKEEESPLVQIFYLPLIYIHTLREEILSEFNFANVSPGRKLQYNTSKSIIRVIILIFFF